jgi:[NiFe] hydrogenase diaphorase moiety small subunit
MSDKITFTIDDKEVSARPEQTIMQAADEAGIYIPRLCAHKDLVPHGSCRVCSVKVNGRWQAACTQPVAEGIVVESESAEVTKVRRDIVEMLFVEGNHFCMFCEKSGNCELQAVAYRLGIASPHYPFLWPDRPVDATHKDIYVDTNRCILCARCVVASRDVDGKGAFEFVGRGKDRRIAVDAAAGLGSTTAAVTDKAADVCPVGCIIKKRVGFKVPVGQRMYDHKPIGSDIEAAASVKE